MNFGSIISLLPTKIISAYENTWDFFLKFIALFVQKDYVDDFKIFWMTLLKDLLTVNYHLAMIQGWELALLGSFEYSLQSTGRI